jgi:hypothetical protein
LRRETESETEGKRERERERERERQRDAVTSGTYYTLAISDQVNFYLSYTLVIRTAVSLQAYDTSGSSVVRAPGSDVGELVPQEVYSRGLS